MKYCRSDVSQQLIIQDWEWNHFNEIFNDKSNESLNISYWQVYIVSKVDKWLNAYGCLTSNKKVADSNPAMDIHILTTSVWINC